MHTFSETGTGVPAFLAKLWRLVDDPETNNLICWSKDGRSFIIQNQAQFARDLLPLNYKHNNMASFIRQLNMYGFHKITSIDNGGLKFDRDEMEFSHPCFKRNCPYLLEHIKRKIANTKSLDDKSAIKTEAVSKVLQDVKAMRGRQDSLDSRFSVMKQENEALWREIASLRQKHAKQQQIVNKLIQFLITIVQPSRNMTSVKRHMQLMINDTPDSDKLRKTSELETECGPVIHELSEELMDDVAENEFDMINPRSPYAASVHIAQLEHDTQSPLNVERPHSIISTMSQNYDYSNQSADDVINVNTFDAFDDNSRKSIIQSVTSDGSEIVYHVTEVPDVHPTETVNTVPSNYSDDNVLTTPMVREQMARSQLLKEKNKQRRNRIEDFFTSSSVSPKFQCHSQQFKSATDRELKIKSEKEIDPMIFLNVYPDNRLITPDPPLISTNNEDSRHSNSRIVSGRLETSKTVANATLNTNRSEELYNPNDFMAPCVPSVIFDDSALNGGKNSNFVGHFQSNAQTQQKHLDQEDKEKEKDQDVRNTTTNGKCSPLFAGNNMSGASTSAAAAAASTAASTDYSSNVTDVDRSRILGQKSDGNVLAMTKFNKSGTINNTNDGGGVMRLSTADEVHGHLENMQDELESLKDLLRADGYSLDANTLLSNGATSAALHNNRIYLAQALDGDFFNKLFNDADILGPYGLSMSADNTNDKKGSELMTYQPIYDLSDIIDINDKTDLDDANSISSPTSSRRIQQLTSALNTPHHE